MNREELLYLVPYLFSLLLSLGVFFYTWRHRHVRGARTYAWFAAGQTLTILGFILELISPTLVIKIFWDKFQWMTLSYLVILPLLVFTVRFSEHPLRHPEVLWGSILIFLVVFTAILLTDDLHHLLYPNPHLSADYPFPELQYDFTYVIYLYALVYLYGANLYGVSLLLDRAVQHHNPHRRQYAIIVAGLLLPLVISLFTLTEIQITPQRDVTPFALALGNLIVAWGLFRYGLFDIAPIAREHIVEDMKEPVIVLDPQNRIVDINQAALALLDRSSAEVIGRTASAAFARWPFVVDLLNKRTEQRKEVAASSQGKRLFFDISVSHILDRHQDLIGWIVVARDITELKSLQISYQRLSEQLEQRVRERTEELQTSAERYRAVVENQTEFIVRWKPDGTRTFVNEAYCRFWGLTYEQALTLNFLFHIPEEDRPAIEEKIRRLYLGAADSETEVHRVVRPDGSVGWQEWTDQVIRDEFGRVVEFQSVGRDITERKQAEDSLLAQLVFDKLMTTILSRFATCLYNEADQAIETALQEIVQFLGADYADVMILSSAEAVWRISHQWRSPTLPEHLRPTQQIQSGRLQWSEKKLLDREPIRIHRLADYPRQAQADREFAESEGTRSLLSVPIQGVAQQMFGCIDLVSYTREIAWTDSDVDHLQMIGDAIANLLERKRAEEDLTETYETTLEGWAKALELRDKETEGHSRRVMETTLIVARAMGCEDDLIHIRHGALLHDIGKMAIPDEILRKTGPLTEKERQIVREHPQVAYDLLVRIPHLQRALEIPYAHHEKWDGTGYPRGLKGTEIPLSARIFAVVDVWDALSCDRPYRRALPQEEVIRYLRDESGKHFDPIIVDVFLQLLQEGKI